MIARLAAAVAAAALLVACGDDADGRYDAQVAEVRQAVEAGDREAALTSLDELGTEAFQAHAAGEVTDDELAALAGLLEHARTQLDEQLPEPTTTASTTTTAPPTTPPAPVFDDDERDDDDEKEGKGKKGKGRGGDDGDDDDD